MTESPQVQGPSISSQQESGINLSVTSLNNGTIPDSISAAAFAAQQAEYRQIAFQELVDSETVHVQELQSFFETYLAPLQKSEL